MTELMHQNLGRYFLEEEIGRSLQGAVYRGKQVALGREVAIKVLRHEPGQDPSLAARFIRAVQIVARLNHPHIVSVYDAGKLGDTLYVAMEYLPGPTIRTLLHLDGRLPQHLAAEYIAQAADAIDMAYQEDQVVHCDIRPEKLRLDHWGRVKVLGFDLARTPALAQVAVTNPWAGSPGYLSPEQIKGESLDNRSDIYALGSVLYELVTGIHPSASSVRDPARVVLGSQVLPPRVLVPEVSTDLEQIILMALATNREERFARARLMADRLRALPQPAHTGSPVAPPVRGCETPVEGNVAEAAPGVPFSRLTLPMRERGMPGLSLTRNREEVAH